MLPTPQKWLTEYPLDGQNCTFMHAQPLSFFFANAKAIFAQLLLAVWPLTGRPGRECIINQVFFSDLKQAWTNRFEKRIYYLFLKPTQLIYLFRLTFFHRFFFSCLSPFSFLLSCFLLSFTISPSYSSFFILDSSTPFLQSFSCFHSSLLPSLPFFFISFVFSFFPSLLVPCSFLLSSGGQLTKGLIPDLVLFIILLRIYNSKRIN